MTETQQRDDLAAALDGFWLTIAGEGRRVHGQIANPDEVADALHATLSRIIAERHPDMPADTADRWSRLRDHIREERVAQDQLAAEHAEYGREFRSARAYGAVAALDRLLEVMDRMEADR